MPTSCDDQLRAWKTDLRGDLLLVLVVLDWVVALGSKDEVSGDEFRALVQQLVERMLGVRCGLAEQDRPSGVLDVVPRPCDGLSV